MPTQSLSSFQSLLLFCCETSLSIPMSTSLINNSMSSMSYKSTHEYHSPTSKLANAKTSKKTPVLSRYLECNAKYEARSSMKNK